MTFLSSQYGGCRWFGAICNRQIDRIPRYDTKASTGLQVQKCLAFRLRPCSRQIICLGTMSGYSAHFLIHKSICGKNISFSFRIHSYEKCILWYRSIYHSAPYVQLETHVGVLGSTGRSKGGVIPESGREPIMLKPIRLNRFVYAR